MIAKRLHSAVDWLEKAWLDTASLWEAKRAAGIKGYVYSQHYTAQNAETWLEHLKHLKNREGVQFLEVGSFEGRSAIWFLENILTHPSATITCVDPFLRAYSEARFDHNISVAGCNSRLIKFKGRSEALLPDLEQGAYDAVYIDGNHGALNVMMDAVAGWRLLKDEGIMILDDYRWGLDDLPPTERPQMAIDLFLDVFDSTLALLHKDRQVIVRKKKA